MSQGVLQVANDALLAFDAPTRAQFLFAQSHPPLYTHLAKPFDYEAPIRKMRNLLERFSPFQIIVTALMLILLTLQIGIILVLSSTRSETQPFVERADRLVDLADGGPYMDQAAVRGLLGLAATELAELAESHIQYTVHISQTVPISTGIVVSEQIAVPVSLVVDQTIPINAEIPFQAEFLIPVNLEINRSFSIDTTVRFQDEIVVPINDVIQIDEIFETQILGQTVRIPIRGGIPIRLDVVVPINTNVPIRTEIPVQFPISETVSVDLDLTVPVDLEIPVNFPVETEVVVPLNWTIPINIEVPLVLDVPIDIAIGDTPLGEYLRNLAEQLP